MRQQCKLLFFFFFRINGMIQSIFIRTGSVIRRPHKCWYLHSRIWVWQTNGPLFLAEGDVARKSIFIEMVDRSKLICVCLPSYFFLMKKVWFLVSWLANALHVFAYANTQCIYMVIRYGVLSRSFMTLL